MASNGLDSPDADQNKKRSVRVLTAQETAEILRVDIQRVYELARTGILPPGVVVRLGRQIRINEDRLRDWLEQGGQSLPGGWRRSADD